MKRVVVTGMGAVTPLGCDMELIWSRLLQGHCGLTAIDSTMKYETKVYGKVLTSTNSDDEKNSFDSANIFGRNDITKEHSNFILYAMYASDLALKNSNILLPSGSFTKHCDMMKKCEYKSINKDRAGVVIGSGGLGSVTDIVQTSVAYNSSFKKVSPYFVPKILGNMAAGYVSIRHGFKGPLHSVATACAAGSHAIGDAYNFIRLGYADVILAGGSESNLDPLSIAGFARLKALSTSDDPLTASRPFDISRNGFVISEGACVMVLEELEHALARNAHIIAEVKGYGLSADAYHGTSPSPTGDGAKRTMINAINDAHLSVNDIGYINAHATSTPVGDAVESLAIDSIFKEKLAQANNNNINNNNNSGSGSGSNDNNDDNTSLYVSSTKGATGHLLGAAGALESAFTCLAIRDNIIPPTLNLNTVSENEKYKSFRHVPGHAVDYVTGTQLYTSEQITKTALINSSLRDSSSYIASSSSSSSSLQQQQQTQPIGRSRRRLRYGMNNSFGFGGVNATLIFGHYSE